jgi:AcrR family transcriptional regulator
LTKRNDVFQAAKSAFVALGYDGTTMDEVARRAGVTKMTVYAHAATKEALFGFIVEESVRLSVEKIWPVDLSGRPGAEIAAFLARFNEIACWHVSIGLQRTIIANVHRFPELARRVHSGVFVPTETALAAALSHWRCTMRAAPLMEAATGQRRHLTLYGLMGPLPLPPSEQRQLQDGAMDQAIGDAVARLTFTP